jgi:hypothetical protein
MCYFPTKVATKAAMQHPADCDATNERDLNVEIGAHDWFREWGFPEAVDAGASCLKGIHA